MGSQKFSLDHSHWQSTTELSPATWQCGYCGRHVGGSQGFVNRTPEGNYAAQILICPNCGGPTFLIRGDYLPIALPGRDVERVPNDLAALFEEARRSASQDAHTAAVLVCRKMLMNIAVANGAEEGHRFVDYVSYLAEHGYVPPNGRDWVDYIRTRGNEATHEIQLMTAEDSTALIGFTEMLLRFIYEFPSMVPPSSQRTRSER